MSAVMSLFRGMFDGPQASGPQEDKEMPVAVGDGVKGGYDAASSPVPGVDAPENPIGEDLGWFSNWWPTMKAGYEMMTKGPEKAEAGTVGEGVTAPLKTWVTSTVDASVPGAGVGTMVGQAIDGLEQTADLFVPHKDGVKGMVGDQVKKTGQFIGTAGGEVLDTVTNGVNTVGGGAVGAVDSVVAAGQHALGVDDGTPVDLPTELEPIEERMDTEWPPPTAPVAPAAPAAPMETVVLPPMEANPLAV